MDPHDDTITAPPLALGIAWITAATSVLAHEPETRSRRDRVELRMTVFAILGDPESMRLIRRYHAGSWHLVGVA